MSYYLSVATFVGITLIGVLGTFLVTGLTGMFSLGQGALMAVGAYISAVLVMKLAFPFPAAFVTAVALAGIIAMVIGYASLRLRQDYFALATFGFGEAIKAILNTGVQFTGGALGLVNIPKGTTTWLVFASLAVVVVLVAYLKNSDFGRRCLAIRDNPLAAEILGVPVFNHKMKVFIIGSMMAAYAGCLFAFFTRYVEPGMFGWMRSAEWIIIVFFGGRTSLTGAIIAGAALISAPEVLRFASQWRTVSYCVLIILVLSFAPGGLMGRREFSPTQIGRWLKRVFARRSPPTEARA